jgi:hypothetical protein
MKRDALKEVFMSKLNREKTTVIAELRGTREPPWPWGRESCRALALRSPEAAATLEPMTAEDYCHSVQFINEVALYLSTRFGDELALAVEKSLQDLEQAGIGQVCAQALLAAILQEVRRVKGEVRNSPFTIHHSQFRTGWPVSLGRAILRVLCLPAARMIDQGFE